MIWKIKRYRKKKLSIYNIFFNVFVKLSCWIVLGCLVYGWRDVLENNLYEIGKCK